MPLAGALRATSTAAVIPGRMFQSLGRGMLKVISKVWATALDSPEFSRNVSGKLCPERNEKRA